MRIAVVALTAVLVARTAFMAYRKGAAPEDLHSWLLGGRAVIEGRDPYSLHTAGWMWFALPPWFALAMVPMAALPVGVAAAAWETVALAAAAAAVWLGARVVACGRRPRDFVLALAPFLLVFRTFDSDLRLLQINSIVLAAIVVGLLLVVRGREFAGGLALGVAACVKLTPVLFLPYLLFTRRLRASAGVTCGVVVLATLPAVWFGWSGNARLLDEYLSERVLRVSEGTEAGNRVPGQSLRSMTFRLLTESEFETARPAAKADGGPRTVNVVDLDPRTVQVVYRFLVAAMLGALALVLWRARGAPPQSSWAFEVSLVLLTMLLVSPYSRKAHFVAVVVPVGACLAYLKARPRIDGNFKLVAAALGVVLVLLGLSTEGAMGDRLSTLLDAYASIGWATLALWIAMAVALWRDVGAARPK